MRVGAERVRNRPAGGPAPARRRCERRSRARAPAPRPRRRAAPRPSRCWPAAAPSSVRALRGSMCLDGGDVCDIAIAVSTGSAIIPRSRRAAPVPAPSHARCPRRTIVSQPADITQLLASVAPLVNTTSVGLRTDERRDLLARRLDDRARAPALGMHRGRVAARHRARQASPRAPRASAAPTRCNRDMCGSSSFRGHHLACRRCAGVRFSAGMPSSTSCSVTLARETARYARRARATGRASGRARRRGSPAFAVRAARHARLFLDRRHDLGDRRCRAPAAPRR